VSDLYLRSVEANQQHARVLLREGRDEDFLTFTEGAVELFPEDPELRLMYATALMTVRPEQAKWEAARAIELDIDDPGRLTRAARLMLSLNEVDAARSYAARATQLAPDDFIFRPELNSVSGVLAALAGEFALAETAMRAAHEAVPSRETFTRDLARFLEGQGRTVEALEIIDETEPTTEAERDALIKLREEIVDRSSQR
jgi:Flp pilus assembly protein TadD